jgi:glycosyltransferase involved in cell wall biosynthesis
MPKKILYLSYDGLTDPLGQSQILPYLQGLSKQGFQFTVLSFEKKQRFAAQQKSIETLCELSSIHWEPLPYHKRPPVFSTLLDVFLMYNKAQSLHKTHAVDIVHCRSYIASLVGQRLKRKYGLTFIFDMRGFWADERVEGGLWNLSNPLFRAIYNYFKRKERQFLSEADHTVSLTHMAKKEIESWFSAGNTPPITVIPCCVDTELFNPHRIMPEEKEVLSKKLGIREGDFILLYLGSVGTWYLLDEMLDFFRVLKQQKPNVRFLFVTQENPSYILDKAQQKNLSAGDFIITSSARQEVPLHISLCSVSIFFIKPTFSKKASSATKMAEIMAMGKPVITNGGWGDVMEILDNPEIGYVIKDFNEENYKMAVSNLQAMQAHKLNTPRPFPDPFDITEGISHYSNCYTPPCL